MVTINRKNLIAALKTLRPFVGVKRPSMVLHSVLVTPTPDGIRLEATNLDTAAILTLPKHGELPLFPLDEVPAPFLLPYRDICEILPLLTGENLTVCTESKRLMKYGDLTKEEYPCLTIVCEGDTYDLPAGDVTEFPKTSALWDARRFYLTGAQFKDICRCTLYAAARDEIRPVLCGVSIVIKEGKLTAVATDTHRLAVRTLIDNSMETSFVGEVEALIPAGVMEVVNGLVTDKGSVEIAFGDFNEVSSIPHTARFIVSRPGLPTITVSASLIDGKFPNWQPIVPTGQEIKVTIQRDDLLSAARRASVVARANANRVILSLDGFKMCVRAEGYLSNYTTSFEIAREGEEIAAAYNAAYLIDMLSAMGTEGVTWELSEPLKPTIFRPFPLATGDYFVVVMPMRVI